MSPQEGSDEWAEIRDRLDQCARAIEALLQSLPDSEPASEADEENEPDSPAERSPPPEAAEQTEEKVEVLTFTVALERFAVERSFVRSSTNASTSPLPISRAALCGAAAVDGTLVPVFDLGEVFDLRPTDEPVAERLLVLGSGIDEIGLVASDPHEPESVTASELAAIPWDINPDDADLIRGVTPTGSILLDARALLDDRRFQIAEPAPEAPSADGP